MLGDVERAGDVIRGLPFTLEHPERHVIDVDDDLGIHQRVDEVPAGGRQAAGIAGGPHGREVGRPVADAEQEVLGEVQQPVLGEVEAEALVRAVVRGEVLAVDDPVGVVVGVVEVGGAAERVVEPVDRVEVPDALRVVPGDLLPQVRVRAAALVPHLAAEQAVHLDAEDDRHLAALDDLPGLLRRVRDPEPAFARPARHPIDGRFERLGRVELPIGRRHVVAAEADPPLRALAERLVVDGQHDHQPLAALVGPLDPLVVRLLVGDRVPLRPAVERARAPDRVLAHPDRALHRVVAATGSRWARATSPAERAERRHSSRRAVVRLERVVPRVVAPGERRVDAASSYGEPHVVAPPKARFANGWMWMSAKPQSGLPTPEPDGCVGTTTVELVVGSARSSRSSGTGRARSR